MTPEQFAESLRKAAEKGGFRAALINELLAGALEAERQAKLNATTTPHPRTGALRASIAGVVRERPGVLEVAVGSGSDTGAAGEQRPSGESRRPGVPYARMQEEGGTVRPNPPRKYLAIPLAAARTQDGGTKSAQVTRLPTSLYDSAPNKFICHPSKDGRLFLWDRVTHTPWYRLKEQTTIPATHFLYRAIDSTTGKLEGSLVGLLEKVLDEAAEGVA